MRPSLVAAMCILMGCASETELRTISDLAETPTALSTADGRTIVAQVVRSVTIKITTEIEEPSPKAGNQR